jgi:hypothetical protein
MQPMAFLGFGIKKLDMKSGDFSPKKSNSMR